TSPPSCSFYSLSLHDALPIWMDLRCRWPCLSFRCRIRRGGGLLLRQQKTSSVSRTPGLVRSLLRRISIPVHVLRGYSAFGNRSSAVQYRHLCYRPDWASTFDWITDRSLRPPLLHLKGISRHAAIMQKRVARKGSKK